MSLVYYFVTFIMSYTGETPLKKKQTNISSFFSKVPAQSKFFDPSASQSECPKETEVGVERILRLRHELCGQPNTRSSAKQTTEIAPGSHLNPMYDLAKYDNHFTLAVETYWHSSISELMQVTVLKEHLLHAKKKARCTSKTIQNECISLAGNAIMEDNYGWD